MKKVCILVVMLLAVLVPHLANAETGFQVGTTCRVSADALNFRQAPQGEVVSVLRNGTTVLILGEKDRNGYYKVAVEGRMNQTGYVYGEYLQRVTPVRGNQKTKTKYDYKVTGVISSNDVVFKTQVGKLNMRALPYKRGTRLKYLSKGQVLYLTDPVVRNGYVEVETEQGLRGFVALDYLTPLGGGMSIEQEKTATLDVTVEDDVAVVAVPAQEKTGCTCGCPFCCNNAK